MQAKKKICAGCNTEQIIYKNIEGKKYCKSCTYKLQPPKAIPKRTEKQVFKMELKKKQFEHDVQFYLAVWYQRFGRIEGTGNELTYDVDQTEKYPTCECCGRRLAWEPNSIFFHHILEKRNFPQFRHKEWNIAIVCSECHNRYETNPDVIPYLKRRREELYYYKTQNISNE